MKTNLKLSKTAIRELTNRYRAVLMAAIAVSAFVAGGANAADTLTAAVSGTTQFMDDLATAHPTWDRNDGVITAWGVDQILAEMAPAAANTDAAVALVNDTTKGNNALYTTLSGKADASTTLVGYGITDAYTKDEVDTALSGKADASTTLAGYGITNAYTKDEVDTALSGKADASTTLAGYGITDAYTKDEVDTALSGKANASTTLAGYGITDAYTKDEVDTKLSNKQNTITNTSTVVADGTGFKVADGSIGATQFDALTKNNMLNNATAGQGLSITDGTDSAVAILDLVLDGETLSKSASGLKIKDGGVGSTQIADKAVGTTQLADIINNNLLSNTTAGDGLTLNAGTVSSGATLDLNLSGSTLTKEGGLKIADKGVDTAQIADKAVGATQLADIINNNLLNSATTTNGIEITDGTGSAVAQIGIATDADINVASVTATTLTGTTVNVDDIALTKVAEGANAYLNVAAGLKAGTSNLFQVDANGDMTVRGMAALDGGLDVNSKFAVAADSGNVTTSGTVDINGAVLTGTSSSLTSEQKLISANGFEVDADNSLLTGALKLAGVEVNTIDTDGSAVAGDDATALATGATIKAGAEDADYTTIGDNITSATTLGDAINTLDIAIGDRTYTNGYNITDGDDVAKSLDDLDIAIGSRTYTNGYNITDGNDVTTSLDDLDIIIGDIANVSNTNSNIAGADIATKLDTVDTNMGDLATISHEAFNGANSDITTAVNTLATNVETATGGTFTAGSWAATVAPSAANGYTYAESANIMDAINQVAGNVGTKDELTTSGINGVDNTKSVNHNVNALNTIIGDVSTLHAMDDSASIGNAMTNGTGTAPATVVEALNNIDATLGTIHGLNEKRGADAKGNLATGTTVEDHLVALDDAIGDRSQFAQSSYLDASAPLANAMMSLDHNLHRVEKEMKGGFASMAALSALQPNARAAGNTQISVGAGAYRDHQGLAIGAFHYFNDNIMANVGASYAGDKSTVFRAGVTFGW